MLSRRRRLTIAFLGLLKPHKQHLQNHHGETLPPPPQNHWVVLFSTPVEQRLACLCVNAEIADKQKLTRIFLWGIFGAEKVSHW